MENIKIMLIFNQRLKELRTQYKKRELEMAIFLDITNRQYQRYEAGTSYPSVHGLIKLAKYFQVSLDYLVGRTDNPKINK